MPFDNSQIDEDEEWSEYSAQGFAVSREAQRQSHLHAVEDAERRNLLADARRLASEVREQIDLLLISAEEVEDHAIAAHQRRIQEHAERLATKREPDATLPPRHTAKILLFPTRR
jgi:response regulator RpfG family c-di-GMP phosphodiesterase